MLKRHKNQEVIIQEIMPHHTFKPVINSHGEYDMKEEDIKSEDIIERLIKHIEILANIGNQQHEAQHFEQKSGTLELKEASRNTITRLNQFEFSMYPKNPLTLEQFDLLRKKISEIASKCHVNLHLVLSSFPVVIENRVENCVVYAQCGEKPILTTIAKKNSSTIDAFHEHPGKREIDAKKQESQLIALSKNNITFDPTIEFKTAGNIPVIAVVEICNDHKHGHGKEILLRKIAKKELKEMKRTHPILTTHIITANSVQTYSNNMLTNKTVYVDPIGSKLIDNTNNFLTTNYSSRKTDINKKMIAISSNKYKTAVSFSSNIIKVENPPFGNNYALYILPEYPITSFSNPEMKNTFNNLYDKERLILLENQFKSTKEKYLILKSNKKRKAALQKIDSLFTDFLKPENKKTDCTLLMLGALLIVAEEAQKSHSSQFFKKKPVSTLYTLLNTLVNDFILAENLDVTLPALIKQTQISLK